MQEVTGVEVTPRAKPDGGFVPIKVWLLGAAFWSYLTGRLSLRAVRVFLALHEMQARRCTLERGRKPHYGLEELRGLVGGVGGAHLRRDLNALRNLGLVRGGGGTIFTWPKSVEDLCLPLDEFQAWFALHFENRARTVPLPRRVLRFLAGAGTKALIATVLGHAMRMLYMRKNLIDPRGRCKLSWVTETFGISQSSAERARAHMVELGVILGAGDTSSRERWCRWRWGGCYYWNLAWGQGEAEGEVARENTPPVPESTCPHVHPGEVPGTALEVPAELAMSAGNGNAETGTAGSFDTGLRGRSKFSTTSLGGAKKDWHPLRESKNQQPTSGRPGAGVSKQDPVGEGGTKSSANAAPPRLKHIEEADLTNPERLLKLRSQAQKAGLVGNAEADLLRFAALAEHAHTYGTTNRGGLFARLLGLWGTAPKWHFITQLDEDRARERLKEHLLGPDNLAELRRTPEPLPRPKPRELSDDARFVQLLRRTLAQRGVPGSVWAHLSGARPEWTRERWDEACRELAPAPQVGEVEPAQLGAGLEAIFRPKPRHGASAKSNSHRGSSIPLAAGHAQDE